jgi:hypothetical protein
MAEPQEPTALKMLHHELAKRGERYKGVAFDQDMLPIYRALMDLDSAGVKVRTSAHPGDVMGFNAVHRDQAQPLVLVLWNRDAEHKIGIQIRVDAWHTGRFDCEMDYFHEEGWLVKRMVKDVQEQRRGGNVQETLAWLMEKIAPCVVEAPGLMLAEAPAAA